MLYITEYTFYRVLGYNSKLAKQSLKILYLWSIYATSINTVEFTITIYLKN